MERPAAVKRGISYLVNQPLFWLALLVLLGFMLNALEPILMPFLLGMLLAYLGDPVADKLETWGLSRSAAVGLCFAMLFIVLVGLLLGLLPLLLHQLKVAYSAAPQVFKWVHNVGVPWIVQTFSLDPDLVNFDRLRKEIFGELNVAQHLLSDVIKKATASTAALVGVVVNLALVPVVTFYLLRDWDVMTARANKVLPVKYQDYATQLGAECNEVVGAFLRGQLWVMLCLAVIYALGLWLAGLKLALLVGLIAGLASIVPYLGFAVGIVAAAVASAVQFGFDWHLLAVAGVFAVGQAIEGMILTPILVGDKIGLHPVAVIFAIMAGGQLFGFAGVLLALPVAAVIMVFLRHIHELYKDTDFYSEK